MAGDQTLEKAFSDLFLISTRKEDTIDRCWNKDQQDWDLGFRQRIQQLAGADKIVRCSAGGL